MKSLSIILAACAIGTTPMQSPEKAFPVSKLQSETPADILGSSYSLVEAIRKDYEKGNYDPFLQEMDDIYASGQTQGELNQLAQMRSGFNSAWQDWESRAQKLQEEKNKELLKAVIGQKKTPFVEKIQSVAANFSSEAQKKAIVQIASYRQMVPGTGKNIDENRLIDIDLEYEFKSLNLDLPNSSPFEKRKQQCVLKMEKLDRMKAASQEFQDSSLKETVSIYAQNFDERLAQSLDVADLNALGNSNRMPADAMEEKVVSILKLYQEKFSEMTQQLGTVKQ